MDATRQRPLAPVVVVFAAILSTLTSLLIAARAPLGANRFAGLHAPVNRTLGLPLLAVAHTAVICKQVLSAGSRPMAAARAHADMEDAIEAGSFCLFAVKTTTLRYWEDARDEADVEKQEVQQG